MYVKSHLKCHLIECSTDVKLECVGVDISLSAEMSFIVICIYRKPSAKVDFYEDLKTLLDSCNHKKEILLVGDFNINWNNKADRKNLKSVTDHFNFTQLIDQPTRITNRSRTRIDLVFTNKPERIPKSHNLLTSLSVHNVIFFINQISLPIPSR